MHPENLIEGAEYKVVFRTFDSKCRSIRGEFVKLSHVKLALYVRFLVPALCGVYMDVPWKRITSIVEEVTQ